MTNIEAGNHRADCPVGMAERAVSDAKEELGKAGRDLTWSAGTSKEIGCLEDWMSASERFSSKSALLRNMGATACTCLASKFA